VNLRRERRPLRVGHRGAPAFAPENTIASLLAAIDRDVDLVEMDVLAVEGKLCLAHGPGRVTDESPSLEEALELVGPRDLGVILDLKSTGIEEAVVALVKARGLVERTVVASVRPSSLRRVKDLEPSLTTGLAYPFDRAGIAERREFQPLIRAGLVLLRQVLPARVGRMLACARADAALLHHSLISSRLVERCHSRGAAVLAWTLEDEEEVRRVLEAGVDGVIANDPGLLGD
jgi:glycerophosphoryl diester phosphodiesterase